MRRPQLHLGRPGGPGIAALVLVGAAIVTAASPLPGLGCASAVQAVAFQSPASEPGGSAPSLSSDVATADQQRVDDAQTALDQHAAAVEAAQKSLDSAAALAQTADDAQSAADSGQYDSSSYDVESAQSAVDSDEQSVTYAQDSIDSANQAIQDAKDGGYYDGSDDFGLSDAQQQLAEAKSQLAADKRALSAATAAATSSSATQAAKEKNAATLAQRAANASQAAQGLVDQASSKQTELEGVLSDATAAQAEHVRDIAAQDNAWSHRHRLAVDDVHAKNLELAACKSAGKRSSGVAGGLLVVALGLILMSWLGRRRA